jgi:valyl-tRNA synthetase
VKEVALAEAKLANPEFTGKAPAAVIDKMQARLDGARGDVARTKAQIDALGPA